MLETLKEFGFCPEIATNFGSRVYEYARYVMKRAKRERGELLKRLTITL